MFGGLQPAILTIRLLRRRIYLHLRRLATVSGEKRGLGKQNAPIRYTVLITRRKTRRRSLEVTPDLWSRISFNNGENGGIVEVIVIEDSIDMFPPT